MFNGSWIFFEKRMNEFWSFYLRTTWLVPRSTWSQRSHNDTGCTLAGSFRKRLLGGGHDSSLYFAQWLRDISKRTENCLKVFTVALCSTWISLRSERFASAWSKDANITRKFLCRTVSGCFWLSFGRRFAASLRSRESALLGTVGLAGDFQLGGCGRSTDKRGLPVVSCRCHGLLLSLPGTRHWWEIACPAALLRLCT